MRPLDPTGLKRLHRQWRRRTEGRVALVLDGVQSPYNVGSILRTAAAWRVEHLWLAGGSASPLSPGARKLSLGTERFVDWSEVATATEAAAAARATGLRVVGLELTDTAVPLHELALGDATCLVVGHEDRGLANATLDACDDLAYLPQLGKVGSLNVAVAAAVALYELRRHEWSNP